MKNRIVSNQLDGGINQPMQLSGMGYPGYLPAIVPVLSRQTSMQNQPAKEVLTEDTGIIFDFRNAQQLAESVVRLLNDEPLRKRISVNAIQKIISTAWENSAVSHAMLFQEIADEKFTIKYNLPESMLYAWLLTGETIYKDIATSSLDFLLSKTFNENGIEVISNKNWLQKGQVAGQFGEQPIDVAYTVMTLSKFYDVFGNEDYHLKMETAFNWFLGENRLHQIIYNPCTGGCYDGLEENHVNLNQGAESTISYLIARLTIEKYKKTDKQYLT